MLGKAKSKCFINIKNIPFYLGRWVLNLDILLNKATFFICYAKGTYLSWYYTKALIW